MDLQCSMNMYIYIYMRIFILQCVLTGGSTTTNSGAFWGGYNGNIIGNYKVLPQFRIAKLVEIPNRTIGFMKVYARHIRPVSGVCWPFLLHFTKQGFFHVGKAIGFTITNSKPVLQCAISHQNIGRLWLCFTTTNTMWAPQTLCLLV